MAKRIARSPYRFLLVALLLVASTMVAADKPDFSGSYTLTGSKGAFKLKKGEVWTLRVTQTESAIDVTKVAASHQNINKFPLDGGEGTYTSPGGQTGTCKAQFKGKNVILDIFVTTHPQPNGPAVRIHTRERWELSSDSKTLTIRNDVDFPQSPLNGFQVIEPWSEIYSRN